MFRKKKLKGQHSLIFSEEESSLSSLNLPLSLAHASTSNTLEKSLIDIKGLKESVFEDRLRIPADVDKALVYQRATQIGMIDKSSQKCTFCGLHQKKSPPLGLGLCKKRKIDDRPPFITSFLILTRFGLALALIDLFFNLKLMLTFRGIYCKSLELKNPNDMCSPFDIKTYLFEIGFVFGEKHKIHLTQSCLEELKESIIWSTVGLFFMFSMLFVIVRIQFRMNVKHFKEKKENRSISEYTLMISKASGEDFTSGETAETDFEKHLESILAQSGYDDQFSVLRKELASSQFMINKLEKEQQKLNYFEGYTHRLMNDDHKFHQKERKEIEKIHKKTKKRLKRLEKRIEKEKFWIRKHCFSEKEGEIKGKVVLAAISSRLTRDRILRAYRENYLSKPAWLRVCDQKPKYILEEGPDPSTTKWHYIGDSPAKLVLFYTISSSIGSMVIVIVALVVIFIQKTIKTSMKNNRKSLLTYLLALQINIVQMIGKKAINKVCQYIRCSTRIKGMILNVISSASVKYCALLVLVQGLFKNQELSDKDRINYVSVVFKSILLLIILEPIKLIFSPTSLKRYYKIFKYKRMSKNGKKRIIMSQEELNYIFEKLEFPYDEIYSTTLYVLMMEFTLSFYIPALPFYASLYLLMKLLINRVIFERVFKQSNQNMNAYSEQICIVLIMNSFCVKLVMFYYVTMMLVRMVKEMGDKNSDETEFFKAFATFSFYLLIILIAFPLLKVFESLLTKWKRVELDLRTETDSVEETSSEFEKTEKMIVNEFDQEYCFKTTMVSREVSRRIQIEKESLVVFSPNEIGRE